MQVQYCSQCERELPYSETSFDQESPPTDRYQELFSRCVFLAGLGFFGLGVYRTFHPATSHGVDCYIAAIAILATAAFVKAIKPSIPSPQSPHGRTSDYGTFRQDSNLQNPSSVVPSPDLEGQIFTLETEQNEREPSKKRPTVSTIRRKAETLNWTSET